MIIRLSTSPSWKSSTLLKAILVTGLAIGFVTSAMAEPEVTTDGLHRIDDSKLQQVWADPDADLSGYQRVFLVEAQVSFRKNWQRDINMNKPYRITNQEMESIRVETSALFGEIFREKLYAAGFQMTNLAAPDVLIVRPAIVDLDPSSPESASGRTRNLTRSAGAMGLYLELRDSETGDLLVKAFDYQVDRSEVATYMKDRTRNERAARSILSDWADILVAGLKDAGANPPPRPGNS